MYFRGKTKHVHYELMADLLNTLRREAEQLKILPAREPAATASAGC